MPFGFFIGALFRQIVREKRRAREEEIIGALMALGIPEETYRNIKEIFTKRVCQGSWGAKERGKEMIFIPENDIVRFIDDLLQAILAKAYEHEVLTERMPESTFHRAQEMFSTFMRKIGWSEINEFAFRIYPEEVGPLVSDILMKVAKALYFEMASTCNEETSALKYRCVECGMVIADDSEVCPRRCFESN